MDAKAIRALPALAGTAVLLAACGGGTQASSIGGLPAANVHTTSWQSPDGNGQGRCQNGELAIHPCHIDFTSSNPGPVTVRVEQQGDHGMIRERDDCASAGIATITRVDNRHFSVAAGATTGSCTGHFTDGQGQGNGAKLEVVNAI